MIKFHRQFDPRQIKLLIFDLDGTLIDSRLDLIHSVNAMLRHFGRPELPGDVIASYVGDGAPMLVRRALGDPRDEGIIKEGLEHFLGYYRVHKLDHTHVYDGIKAMLTAIRNSNGIPRQMAVLSNKPVNPSRAIVEALGLASSSFTSTAETASPPRSPIRKGAQTILRETKTQPERNSDGRRFLRRRHHRPQRQPVDLRRNLRLRPAHALRSPAGRDRRQSPRTSRTILLMTDSSPL